MIKPNPLVSIKFEEFLGIPNKLMSQSWILDLIQSPIPQIPEMNRKLKGFILI